MRVDPNIPIWLAQSITGFSEVERMYALNYAIHQLDPQLRPSVYDFCLSYRPAMSREAQMLVDQLGYQNAKGAAMHGYQYQAPAMGGFRIHQNANAAVAGNLAASCGLTGTPMTGGLGSWGDDLQKSLTSAVNTGVSVATAITNAIGTPPQAGSQTNPTGWADMNPDIAFGPMTNQLPIPAAPAATTPVATPPVVVKKPMSTGMKIGLGVGAVLLVGGLAYAFTR